MLPLNKKNTQTEVGMLEQQDLTNLQRQNREDITQILELARKSHESYLLRNNNKDLDNAVNYYIQAIKQNPEIPEIYYRLASLLWENGQISLDSAIEQCRIAINIDPKNSNAHIYTGYFLKLANNLDEAERELKNAININPIMSARPRLILAAMLYQKIHATKLSFVEFIKMVYYACSGCLTVLWDLPSLKMLYKNITNDAKVMFYKSYGTFLEKVKKPSQAIQTYDDGAEYTGHNELFYHKIGDVSLKENVPEIALDAYKKVLQSNPYDRNALIKTATVIQTYFEDQQDTAIDCYNRLLELEPDNEKVYYELGHLYLQKNNFISAINAFNIALEIDEENPFYHNSIAFALVQLDQYDEAIEHYQKAININPDPIWTSIVCQALGSVYMEIKENPEAAIVLYQTACVLNPDSDECHIAIGDIYFSQDDYENAIKSYCDAIKLNPDNAKAYGKCGMALWEKDYVEEAIIAYNKAIAIDTEYAIAYNNLGVIYLDGIGNLNEAERLFTIAVELNPNYTLAQFNLGRVYQNKNDPAMAAEYYQTALNLNKITNDLDEEDIQNRLHKLFEV